MWFISPSSDTALWHDTLMQTEQFQEPANQSNSSFHQNNAPDSFALTVLTHFLNVLQHKRTTHGMTIIIIHKITQNCSGIAPKPSEVQLCSLISSGLAGFLTACSFEHCLPFKINFGISGHNSLLSAGKCCHVAPLNPKPPELTPSL